MILMCFFVAASMSIVPAQDSPDPASAAKTLNLRLTVNSGGKVKNGTKLAVIPFIHTNGQFSEFSTYFASELVSAMFKLKTVQPIERSQAEAILNEITLGSTGLMDDSTAARAGKLKGAEALLVGEIAEMSGGIVINARIVSATTGEVLSAANIKLKKNSDVERMMKNIKGELSGKDKDGSSDREKKDRKNDAPGKALAAGDWHGFHIELLGCTRVRDKVELDFIITNNLGENRTLTIKRSEAIAYDEKDGKFNGFEPVWSESIPSGVSVKAKIRIGSVSPDIVKFRLFEFNVSDEKSRATLPIKNIPITETD